MTNQRDLDRLLELNFKRHAEENAKSLQGQGKRKAVKPSDSTQIDGGLFAPEGTLF